MISENDMLTLSGKRILLFSPTFFGYEYKIQKEIQGMGATVDMYDVRSVTTARDRALLKIFPPLFLKNSKNYYDRILQKSKDKDYDYILIIKCDMTPVKTLKQMRELFPNAKLCLYLWDSVKNIPFVTNKFQYFDILHSFDLEDSKKYQELKFRPLFFVDEFKKPIKNENNYKHDISFCGTIHSDRYKVIKQVNAICAKKGIKFFTFCYLQSKFIYNFYKIFKKEFKDTRPSDFSFNKMSGSDIATIVYESGAVLDIQHPKQTGLTMRTIEMIGMNKKLITTNASIKNYDFYNPNNIRIIDRNNVTIDLEFLKTPYQELPEDLYKKYSLEQWILDVIELQKNNEMESVKNEEPIYNF